jgi:hypothetical protein
MYLTCSYTLLNPSQENIVVIHLVNDDFFDIMYTSGITGFRRLTYLCSAAAGSQTAPSVSLMLLIASSSNNYFVYAMQYLPIEVYKKLVWIAYHPKYIRFKLQIQRLVKKYFGNKEAVKVADKRTGKRLTEQVDSMLNDLGTGLVGRQVCWKL